MQTLDEQMHVAELAGMAVYARAVLARAASDEPEVVSLRLTVTRDGSDTAIDVEIVGASGHALGGYAL